MLWQHDPAQPIGIWDEVREDAYGLYVKGRMLTEVAKGREAAALIGGGGDRGLSIGYRTVEARTRRQGAAAAGELELWEVSLVTFPMLPRGAGCGQGARPTPTDGATWRRRLRMRAGCWPGAEAAVTRHHNG